MHQPKYLMYFFYRIRGSGSNMEPYQNVTDLQHRYLNTLSSLLIISKYILCFRVCLIFYSYCRMELFGAKLFLSIPLHTDAIFDFHFLWEKFYMDKRFSRKCLFIYQSYVLHLYICILFVTESIRYIKLNLLARLSTCTQGCRIT